MVLEGADVGVEVADQMLDEAFEEIRSRLVAVEQRDLVSARQGVFDLFRPREPGAADDEQAQWLRGLADGRCLQPWQLTRRCLGRFGELDLRAGGERCEPPHQREPRSMGGADAGHPGVRPGVRAFDASPVRCG